jgi:hypothetical protein
LADAVADGEQLVAHRRARILRPRRKSTDRAKEIAARTVNKQRAKSGETKSNSGSKFKSNS